MIESEKVTRKNRIDNKLEKFWKIIHARDVFNYSVLSNHAVEEYPTAKGFADYALFVNGRLLGFIEAKKISVGTENVLEQAKRYATDIPNTIGEWGEYKAPFLFSSNGEKIFFLDIRNPLNISRELSNFYSPDALLALFESSSDSAIMWLQQTLVNEIKRLRYYQVEAIEAIEQALLERKRKMLLAMATGTGKTFTIVSLIYRLLKSGYAKRILFLVDRRALAAQAVTAMSAFATLDGLKLDKEYEVYSQKFQREDFDENVKFDSKVMPNDYLTNPQDKHTFVYISTIQRITINLFGLESWQNKEYEPDVEKLDIPINAFDVIIADECHRGYSASETGTWKKTLDHFDAIKIGLTATPAAHTMAMFTHKVYTYSTDQAIEDGFLVDYDAIKINSKIKIEGAFLKKGEIVGEIDTETGSEQLDELEDEREYSSCEIEEKITIPDCTRKIIKELKKHSDQFEKETGRFPKTLIFAVNDIEHISHCDEVVRNCKDVFGKGDDFVKKITGSPSVDRPLQKIREFRNRKNPKIVVTVDMLSTGVDIPAIEFIVFMRMVKSRILWVQMLGRGTRRCDEIHKDRFVIFDCFDGSLIEYFKNVTDFKVQLSKEILTFHDLIERIYNNQDRSYNISVLIKRLRRIEKTMSGEAIEQFADFIPEGDLKKFTDNLSSQINNNFIETMKILINKDFQTLLTNYKRPKKIFLKAYDTVDEVSSEMVFSAGDKYEKPEDYLKSFERFVKENPEHIEAIEILLHKPDAWSYDALEELRKALKQNRFKEKDLQCAHEYLYKKPLPDIISMVKHAADFDVPILSAKERMEKAIQEIASEMDLNEEQQNWLGYIKHFLINNLALEEEDFSTEQTFARHGGRKKAKQVFGDKLSDLIKKINAAIAA